MKVPVKIYLVQDSLGNRASATCEDSAETIQICGLRGIDGEPTYFESDAYHLKAHCKEVGLELKIIDMEHDFDELWDKNK